MQNSVVNTVVVGGGPVGLWTAVQAKIRNKNANIVIFEKHEEYQRKHVLKISKSSLKGAPKHPKLDPIIKEFTAHPMIRTSVIEGKLKKLAQELGIEIRHEAMDKTSYRTDAAHGRVARAFNRYASYAKRLAFFETLIARIKNLFIRFLNWFVRFSNRNPIQTNKWSEQDIIAFGGQPRPKKISKISDSKLQFDKRPKKLSTS